MMVKIINKSVCRGVAGRRTEKVKGVVIHNTADNGTALNHMNRLAGYSNRQLENGFAHYFIDDNTIIRTEDTYNMAWHTANADGNANYIGYEVCHSTGDLTMFKKAEQNTFKQVAEDLKYYGLPANRNTVRLHREFVATACPHRSWEIHGKSVNAVKDYFITEIKKYMNGGTTLKPSKQKEASYYVEANCYFEIVNVNVYDKPWFTSKTKRKTRLPKTALVWGREIKYSPEGYPRIKTGLGYISANTSNVIARNSGKPVKTKTKSELKIK